MGMSQHICFRENRFPAQSNRYGKTIEETDDLYAGEIVREDLNQPGVVIVKMTDGTYRLPKTIDPNFPEPQGSYLGKDVNVCTNYDTDHIRKGKLVRDDMSLPFHTIIELDGGRVILATECMYQPE